MAQGVIESVPVTERALGFYSILFTVPKLNRDVQPILDLKNLNKFLKVRSFCMDSVRSMVQQGDFLVSIDIRDAYLHVATVPAHPRLLSFVVGDQHLQFVALPFRLAMAPWCVHKSAGSCVGYIKGPRGVHAGIPGQPVAQRTGCTVAKAKCVSHNSNILRNQVLAISSHRSPFDWPLHETARENGCHIQSSCICTVPVQAVTEK